MEVIVVKNYQELSEKAFEMLKALIIEKPDATIGFATGSTPVGLYQLMVKDHLINQTSYQKMTAFNLDEYIGLPQNHPESYYTFMRTNLFNTLDVNFDQVYIPAGDARDIVAEGQAYEVLLDKYPIDFQILGIGTNAHIGFNEPNTPLDSLTGVVDLTEDTIKANARFFENDPNQVPTQAISMGIASILKAKKIVLLASGASKAEAIYNTIHGPVTAEVPSSALQNHPNVTLIIDEAAASKL